MPAFLVVVLLCGAEWLRDATAIHAGPGGPVQNFSADADTCWGTPPGTGPACGTGTNTGAAAGETTSYATVKLDYGSRLAHPVTFSPAAFAPSTPPPSGANVGDVTLRLDAKCDSGSDDIIADDVAAAGTPGAWPATWTGEELLHQAAPDAYIDAIKPFPDSFAAISSERADLDQIWINGMTALSIGATTGRDMPVVLLTEASSYNPSLYVSYLQVSGQPQPVTDIFCFDSPQDSVMRVTIYEAPATAGMYARWTLFTSEPDLRAREVVSRLVDLQCVTIGPVVSDADGDCLNDASDADDGDPDQDNDGLVDGIETTLGSSPTAADADLDGANDYTEMAQFTDPSVADTDGDGQLDLQDNGADDEPATRKTIEDTAADDNCPNAWNSTQLNTDSPRFAPIPQPINNDSSDPGADINGDACDPDDDNDGMTDVVEHGLFTQVVVNLFPDPAQVFVPDPTDPDDPNYCGDINKTSLGDGSDLTPDDDFTQNPTNSLDEDSDNDGTLDGAECVYNMHPLHAGLPRLTGTYQFTHQEVVEIRALGVNHRTIDLVGAPEADCDDMLDDDGDLVADDGCSDGGRQLESQDFDGDESEGHGGDVDSDNDGALNTFEVWVHATRPSSDDSDGDGCTDGQEIADVPSFASPNTIPANRVVNVVDLAQIAAAAASSGRNIRNVPGPTGLEIDQGKVNFDVHKNGSVDIIDLAFVANQMRRFAVCPPQGGLTITHDTDGNAP